MPVNQPHSDYDKCLKSWELVRDCYKGSKAIKSKSGRPDGGKDESASIIAPAGSRYLPVPNPDDNSQENRLRYAAYLTRAVFVNFVGITADSFHGMAFRKPPIIEEPPALLKPCFDNFDGEGNSIQDCIKRTTHEVLLTAREGLLMDYPVAPQGGTIAQTQNLHPYIRRYKAESIINWKTQVFNGQVKLVLVVLCEEHEKQIDDFTTEASKCYRALRLVDGVYVQEMYDENGDPMPFESTGEYVVTPKNAKGETFGEILFTFVGAVNNDKAPDKPLLLDIAEVNIAHYRNSADHEESCFMVGQPTFVISGLKQNWYKEILKEKIKVGSRGGIPLNEGASAQLLQASPNQMPLEAMDRKEQQMVKLGAKIIEDTKNNNETAKGASLRYAGQTSKLGSLVHNVGLAYEKLLIWASQLKGVDYEPDIKMNDEFYDEKMDPQEILAAIQLYDRQAIAMPDLRAGLRQSGFIDSERTDDDIENDLGEVNPTL